MLFIRSNIDLVAWIIIIALLCKIGQSITNQLINAWNQPFNKTQSLLEIISTAKSVFSKKTTNKLATVSNFTKRHITTILDKIFEQEIIHSWAINSSVINYIRRKVINTKNRAIVCGGWPRQPTNQYIRTDYEYLVVMYTIIIWHLLVGFNIDLMAIEKTETMAKKIVLAVFFLTTFGIERIRVRVGYWLLCLFYITLVAITGDIYLYPTAVK